MDGITAWLTPARRKAGYTLMATSGAALVLAGVITQDQLSAWLPLIALAGSSLFNLLAATKTDTTTATGMPAEEITQEGA